MPDRTTEVVGRFLDALGDLDTEGVLAEAADDIVVQLPAAPPGLPREAVGKAAFAEFLTGISALWTSFSLSRSVKVMLSGRQG